MTGTPFNAIERRLEHFKQRSNWDCGVSCVLMVLPPFERNYFLANFKRICKEEGFNHSTWTIDLCYLLKRFNIAHSYFTVTMGVHPSYKGNDYYENLILKDELRVKERFMRAYAENVTIKCGLLTIDDIVKHLVSHGPIILLVNVNLLTCDLCKVNKLSLEFRSCFPWPVQYMGHYIVLCGYNHYKKKILYRNPTYRDKLCAISFQSLDDARKSYGTDEDVILIFESES